LTRIRSSARQKLIKSSHRYSSFPSDGTIKELKAEPGDNVKVGEVIMILNTGDDKEEETQSFEESDDVNKKERKIIQNPNHQIRRSKLILKSLQRSLLIF